MNTVTIRGHSDDCIVIQGAIHEEFSAYEAKSNIVRFLGFSDGTLLRITYGEHNKAMWRISLIRKGTAEYIKAEAEEGKSYSDQVSLEGDVSWVVCGKDYRIAR